MRLFQNRKGSLKEAGFTSVSGERTVMITYPAILQALREQGYRAESFGGILFTIDAPIEVNTPFLCGDLTLYLGENGFLGLRDPLGRK